MANKHATLKSLFDAIANAIRGKTGNSEEIVADDFPEAIAGIQSGGEYIDASKITVDIASGKITVQGEYSDIAATIGIQRQDATAQTIAFLVSDSSFPDACLISSIILTEDSYNYMHFDYEISGGTTILTANKAFASNITNLDFSGSTIFGMRAST